MPVTRHSRLLQWPIVVLIQTLRSWWTPSRQGRASSLNACAWCFSENCSLCWSTMAALARCLLPTLLATRTATWGLPRAPPLGSAGEATCYCLVLTSLFTCAWCLLLQFVLERNGAACSLSAADLISHQDSNLAVGLTEQDLRMGNMRIDFSK
jgi:hypothetical protein